MNVPIEQFVRDAVAIANQALSQIQAHEKSCDRRTAELKENVNTLFRFLEEKHAENTRRIAGVERILIAATMSSFGGLIVACGTLAVMAFKHN